ncbi:MAG TPA: threonine synthase [Tessaracoccus flavescens]|uniref:Threonine synthase n=1 Tax=Tessaracoccus flavescens TaxID=399497 RepID=A0A921EQ00_9ACTN|nr:threonine synthase [Tessaracoccus flavescens]
MRYVSTRDTQGLPGKQFCDILLEGLAADGGLYLPETYPTVSPETLDQWRTLLTDEGYAALAFEVIRLFVDDIPDDDLRGIITRAYSPAKFSDPAVVPVTQLSDGLWLAHLSNGPSAAFKDMAMQLLGELFAYELGRRGETITIVGATSGDTGSSAEYALRGKPGVRVFMLSPKGRMTAFQQAQMFSIDDPAIVNVAVDGVFDDCQDLVKELNNDPEFKAAHKLGAVNSINWARLMAQVVYYFAAWLQVSDGEPISFAVPSGNFGNVAAGHIARQMGLPIHRLIVATNENNVLEEFFRTGHYRVRGAAETLATSSPSMDISKASNFERFIYDLVGRDAARVRELFVEGLRDGEFSLADTPEFVGQLERFGFVSGTSTHADRLHQIRRVYEADGYTLDPHTADGVEVALGLAGGAAPGAVGIEDDRPEVVSGPIVVLETALPIKFADTIVEAIGMVPPRPARFEGIEDLPRHVVEIPNDADALRQLIEQRA